MMSERWWSCFTVDFVILNVVLASIDALLAILAFTQLLRMHIRNQQNGWERQKVLHLMVGTSNLGYFIYFTITAFATCNGWHCWFGACSFIFMASAKVLFLAVFLLLLSFWVDLCHQEDEEEDNVENRTHQALLEGMKKEQCSAPMNDCWSCCSSQGINIGSRQKYVIMVVVLLFIVMMSCAVLIWIGEGKSSINPSLVAQVYEMLLAGMILILAGGLGFYGLLLFIRLRRVRSQQASSEIWKVGSLAIICIICFSTSALVSLNTKNPIIYGVKACIFFILYYFIGSSLPSAYLLWTIRELPAIITDSIEEQPRRITFISQEEEYDSNQPLLWTIATRSQNQMTRASPI